MAHGDTMGGVNSLAYELLMLRLSQSDAEWKGCIETLRQHSIFGLLQQNPYMQRAFTKPREYPGDAVMMDYVYGIERPETIIPIGAKIFEATTSLSKGKSVRARRKILAERPDSVGANVNRASVLSLGSGHN